MGGTLEAMLTCKPPYLLGLPPNHRMADRPDGTGFILPYTPLRACRSAMRMAVDLRDMPPTVEASASACASSLL